MSLKSDFGSLGVELLHCLLCVLAELGRRHQGLIGSAGVRRQQQSQLHQPSAPSPGACTSQGTGEGLASVFVGSSSSETNGRQMGKQNSIFCSLLDVEKLMDWLQHARFVEVYLVLFE